MSLGVRQQKTFIIMKIVITGDENAKWTFLICYESVYRNYISSMERKGLFILIKTFTSLY